MDTVPRRALSDGASIPAAGFGTYPLSGSGAESAVREAIAAGYRLIDTAASYGNEAEVGRAVATSGVPREEVVLMTKLRGRDQGYERTLAAFEESAARLGVDYVDIYLIHWPLPRLDAYADSWRAMIKLRDEGRIRSIGVSNFTPAQLDRLSGETGVTPSVNQIELHPRFPQPEQREADAARGVATVSWSPLGRGSGILDDPVVTGLARSHGVTPAQVVLRWHHQLGAIPIAKSATPERQRANLDLFGFELTAEEMAALSGLERGRLGGDPDTHEEF
ncbi:2,5-diketo-D-gluconic acid reductase [Streptomyces antioxidans]|uniref:2,5-diketo-D-gluconic acid reductase n=1 Tax=Streptomyces antioxidans TaxID=1507734 RepID=A0A1V4D9M7_9ACTN|nr:aldo/keto reductase [Streptomyces antioxidans]OPF81843.1 2,5-diketo-D-gluconic acid reductase [Streptomyces antioxidans]